MPYTDQITEIALYMRSYIFLSYHVIEVPWYQPFFTRKYVNFKFNEDDFVDQDCKKNKAKYLRIFCFLWNIILRKDLIAYALQGKHIHIHDTNILIVINTHIYISYIYYIFIKERWTARRFKSSIFGKHYIFPGITLLSTRVGIMYLFELYIYIYIYQAWYKGTDLDLDRGA